MSCCSKLGHTSFQAIALWIQFMVTREPAMIRVTQLMYWRLTDTTAAHVDTDNERVLLYQININRKLLQFSDDHTTHHNECTWLWRIERLWRVRGCVVHSKRWRHQAATSGYWSQAGQQKAPRTTTINRKFNCRTSLLWLFYCGPLNYWRLIYRMEIVGGESMTLLRWCRKRIANECVCFFYSREHIPMARFFDMWNSVQVLPHVSRPLPNLTVSGAYPCR